ncbi:hypothetical protein [Parageobacillus thermoglucosidasius]|nr:hypothetical protein [Parageobacillus thermoglucosidasius]AEH49830.1 hypothetical protein Geoth_0011 [Parageobacillus thermoglucosidasius C56-YS93]
MTLPIDLDSKCAGVDALIELIFVRHKIKSHDTSVPLIERDGQTV